MSRSYLNLPQSMIRQPGGGPCGGPFSRVRSEELDRLDVRGLLSLGAFDDVELHRLTLTEGAVAFASDRREVNEHVVAIGASDEAVTLLVAEPLHRSCRQPEPPCTSRRTARQRGGERSMEPPARQRILSTPDLCVSRAYFGDSPVGLEGP